MENMIKIFESEEFGRVRTVIKTVNRGLLERTLQLF